MGENVKILKGIFFFIMGLIMVCCTGVIICALNPSLTAMLAERLGSVNPVQSVQEGQSGGAGNLIQDEGEGGQPDSSASAESQPGINADWLERQPGYEQPGGFIVEAPDSVSGRPG